MELTTFLLRSYTSNGRFHPRKITIRKCHFRNVPTWSEKQDVTIRLFDAKLLFFKDIGKSISSYSYSSVKTVPFQAIVLHNHEMGCRLQAELNSDFTGFKKVVWHLTDFLGKTVYSEFKAIPEDSKILSEILAFCKKEALQKAIFIEINFFHIQIQLDSETPITILHFQNYVDQPFAVKLLDSLPITLGAYVNMHVLTVSNYSKYGIFTMATGYMKGILGSLRRIQGGSEVILQEDLDHMVSVLANFLKSIDFFFFECLKDNEDEPLRNTLKHLIKQLQIPDLSSIIEQINNWEWVDNLSARFVSHTKEMLAVVKEKLSADCTETIKHSKVMSWTQAPGLVKELLGLVYKTKKPTKDAIWTSQHQPYQLKSYWLGENQLEWQWRPKNPADQPVRPLNIKTLLQQHLKAPVDEFCLLLPHQHTCDGAFVINFEDDAFDIIYVQFATSDSNDLVVQSSQRLPEFKMWPHDFRYRASKMGLTFLHIGAVDGDGKKNLIGVGHCNIDREQPGSKWHHFPLKEELESKCSLASMELLSIEVWESKLLIFAPLLVSTKQPTGESQRRTYVVWFKVDPHRDTSEMIGSQIVPFPTFPVPQTSGRFNHSFMKYRSQMFSLSFHTPEEKKTDSATALWVGCLHKNQFVSIGGSNINSSGAYLYRGLRATGLQVRGVEDTSCGVIGYQIKDLVTKDIEFIKSCIFLPNF